MAPGPTCTDYPNEWPPGRVRSRERKPPAAWRGRDGRRGREGRRDRQERRCRERRSWPVHQGQEETRDELNSSQQPFFVLCLIYF